jgi:hypothetical protein
MTSNFGKEFHSDYTHMLGAYGKTLIHRNMETFQKTYNQRREKEEFDASHKGFFAPNRKTFKRWNPNSFHGRELQNYPVDMNTY